jgi:hypothetical protein
MLQRAKNNKSLYEAGRLLQLRDDVRAKYGDDYRALTEPFKPFVQRAMQQIGCPTRAVAIVVSQMQPQQQTREVKKLVTCAALDLVVKDFHFAG